MKTALCLLAGSLLFAVGHAQLPEALDPSLSPMRGVIERFTTDESALGRYLGSTLSLARHDRLRAYYEGQARALDAMDFDKLDQAGRVEYVLLRNRFKFELAELALEQRQNAEAAPLLPFADEIVQLDEARRRMEWPAPPESALVLVRVAEETTRIRKSLERQLADKKSTNTPPNKVVANRAARLVDGLRRTLKDWHDFRAGYDPEFTWWMRQPFEKADKELYDYSSFLRKKLAGVTEGDDEPVIGDPIGREALLAALANDMIPYTPEELIDIANREFAWCETEWKRAARDLGFGEDWRKALDHVSKLYVKPGDQPKLIHDLALEAVKFVEDNNLVTVPPLCKETWRMEMMTPERQKVNPYFTGGEVISVSFPTDTMTHEDKLMSLRGNNIHFCRATVQHELIPGHHLQGFMGARYNTHRRAFRTPFIIEGWALYWEMLLWDKGFPKSAEDRVGMLFWRTHRCARIIFSLNFHLGKMTAPEAIDFLVDRVGHERRNATAEVRRSVAGNYGPLYQAAYMLGGLQIRALRRELVDTGKMTDREFHDAILKENAIPVEMIRADLTKQPLTRDFQSRWRFYEQK